VKGAQKSSVRSAAHTLKMTEGLPPAHLSSSQPASPLRAVALSLMVVLLLSAGVMHFLRPGPFVQIVPPAVPWPRLAVYLSGGAELLLAVALLLPRLSRLAALGTAALFIAVFPANLYHWLADVHVQGAAAAPGWYHALRIPAQALLVAWALWLWHRPRVPDVAAVRATPVSRQVG
jgi:uncharacterized membrane protein